MADCDTVPVSMDSEPGQRHAVWWFAWCRTHRQPQEVCRKDGEA